MLEEFQHWRYQLHCPPLQFLGQPLFLDRSHCPLRMCLVAVEARRESWATVDGAFSFAEFFWTGSCLQTTAKEREDEIGYV